MTTDTEKRVNKLNDMRALLDFLEDNPDVTMPYLSQVDAFAESEDLEKVARALGTFDKDVNSIFFTLHKRFGKVWLKVNFSRSEVCERVVTGTEEIPEEVIPARTRDVVEWVCPEAILTRAGSA